MNVDVQGKDSNPHTFHSKPNIGYVLRELMGTSLIYLILKQVELNLGTPLGATRNVMGYKIILSPCFLGIGYIGTNGDTRHYYIRTS